MSSIGNSGARSAGPIGWPVPGCRTGAGGVFRSAAMLYHLVGMSLSVRTYLVCALSAMGDLPREKCAQATRTAATLSNHLAALYPCTGRRCRDARAYILS